jgi:hypothetical protein
MACTPSAAWIPRSCSTDRPSAQHGRAPDSYQIQLRTFHDELIWYRNGRGCVLSPCASTRFSVLMGRATPWHFFILRRPGIRLSLEVYGALMRNGMEPPPAGVRPCSPATRAPCPAAHRGIRHQVAHITTANAQDEHSQGSYAHGRLLHSPHRRPCPVLRLRP